MTKLKYLLLFLLCLSPIRIWAQTGHRISGNVYSDLEGPLMMVNVVEKDKNNRIVEATITDMSGNFSMTVKNPADKLEISYVGFKTQVLEIGNRTVFNIKMVDDTQLQEVVVKAKPKGNSNGLSIPAREISVAQQKMSMDDMAGLSFTSVDEAMQGRIAGLDIVANSGDLGSGTSMRLRGVTTINSNAEPLIVVNDNIYDLPSDEEFDFANANEESFAQLLTVNPDDILEIDVLKDAAACAIYGSRGANGVIKIKTRRGARGKTQVNYSYTFKGSYQPAGIDMLNGDEYTMLIKEAHFNPSQVAINIPEISYLPTFSEYENFNNNTDWVDEVTKFGQSHKHYLTIEGGGEKANFRVSGGYDHETGTIIKQQLNRFSTRMALDYFVSDRIKFIADFALTYTDHDKNYDNGILGDAYNIMPNMSVFAQDKNGNNTAEYYQMLQSASGVFDNDMKKMINPVARAEMATRNDKTYRITPDFRIEYQFMGLDDSETQLKYQGSVFMDIFTQSETTFYPRTLTSLGWDNENVNKTSLYDKKQLGLTTKHALYFTPKFSNPDHFMTMMAQFELIDGSGNDQNNGSYGLPYGSITSSTVDAYQNVSGTGTWQWRSMSLRYSLHYSYKSTYAIGFTMSRDGSTKYGADRRWGNFPSVSLRWNISDEKFMEKLTWLSMLSFRPSWGIVGNQPSSEYLFYTKYSKDGMYNGVSAISPSGIRLSNLRWEKTTSYNLGGDLGLFDDLITADFNYYNKLTEDLLMRNRGIASSNGWSSLSWQNVGSLRNEGWELNVNANDFVKVGKFSISASMNVAQNRCEIEEMDQAVLADYNKEFTYANGEYLQRLQVGNAVGSIYGFKYKGVYQYDYKNYKQAEAEGATSPVARDAEGKILYNSKGEPLPMYYAFGTTSAHKFSGGDAIYEDINHDGNINELDMVYLGSSNPKVIGGFGLTFRYGRWTLKSNFSFRYGNKILNRARMNNENMYGHNNQSKAVNWRWRKEGDFTTIPRALYNTGHNYLGSDRFVEDGSFCRLQYLQLTYSVAPAWLKNYGLNKLNFSASANNLFCWTKYSGVDPEVGYGGMGISEDNARTPRSKSFTFNIGIGF